MNCDECVPEARAEDSMSFAGGQISCGVGRFPWLIAREASSGVTVGKWRFLAEKRRYWVFARCQLVLWGWGAFVRLVVFGAIAFFGVPRSASPSLRVAAKRWARKFKNIRGVAQPGRALRSGRRGRKFESCHPDFVWTAFTIRGECFQQRNAVCLWNWPSFMIISSLLRFCSRVMSLTGLPSIKSRSAR